mmetsp:Transcript_3720/g.11519  ORF Transcript_3720/g.11519 Transcript_3720/m.11519 type:complete len:224 (+) Transcript_3720:294-965(+)
MAAFAARAAALASSFFAFAICSAFARSSSSLAFLAASASALALLARFTASTLMLFRFAYVSSVSYGLRSSGFQRMSLTRKPSISFSMGPVRLGRRQRLAVLSFSMGPRTRSVGAPGAIPSNLRAPSFRRISGGYSRHESSVQRGDARSVSSGGGSSSSGVRGSVPRLSSSSADPRGSPATSHAAHVGWSSEARGSSDESSSSCFDSGTPTSTAADMGVAWVEI